MLYEVTNPHEYITPDVIADFTSVRLQLERIDCVSVNGGGGKQKPTTLKVSVGYNAGFVGEGEISYAGMHAIERAQLAGETIRKRLEGQFPDLRIDCIGCLSVHPPSFAKKSCPYEVRLRVAGKAATAAEAALIGEEVEALYTNGPAGGGGVRKYVNEVVGVVSTRIDRNLIKATVTVKQHDKSSTR